ncbi:DUF7288 family protein [Methanocella sp. MCL-LM]|uniref:DUF7288 family protein n=1 Tax=Methanocella sp. MCL-LM TaxID=3412035 RepID=UPI003C7473D0
MVSARNPQGQVQTIEAFIATFILLAVLAVVVQATSVTPLTTSFTNQHIKYELQNMGQDILTSLDEMPAVPDVIVSETTPSRLEQSICYWLVGDDTVSPPLLPGDWYTFEGIDSSGVGHFKGYTSTTEHVPTTYLEKALTFAFSESGIAYNVEIRYPDTNGNVFSRKMIWNGDPSDNSVTVSRYVALHDQTEDPVGIAQIPSLLETNGKIVIPDISTNPDSALAPSLHNVVEIRLTLWVM